MKFICQVCGYVYDETQENASFDTLPEDWNCPLCGAPKSVFSAASENGKKEQPKVSKPMEATLGKLSAGQLAAVCSNLARGCEKQYKTEEAELFRQLADYFTSVVPEKNFATVEGLAETLQKDVDDYAHVRATADAQNDRGAARVCVWGEKVTRMLSSLVDRYLKEGEKMLEDTNLWVCSVCGFVYVGNTPPELCPVCKVPDWKFEKIEGRNL